MSTRHVVRDTLVTLLAADTTSFNTVNGYAPLETFGATKILNVYSKQTAHEFLSNDLNYAFYQYSLDFLAKRDNTTAAEDAIDAAAESIRSIMRANVSNVNWSNVQLESESEPYFATISGVPYRCERHSVKVKVIA